MTDSDYMRVYAAMHRAVRAWARKHMREGGDDVAAQVWLSAWAHRAACQASDDRQRYAWVWAIARNETAYQSRRARPVLSLETGHGRGGFSDDGERYGSRLGEFPLALSPGRESVDLVAADRQFPRLEARLDCERLAARVPSFYARVLRRMARGEWESRGSSTLKTQASRARAAARKVLEEVA